MTAVLKDFSEEEMLSTIQEQYEEMFGDWSFYELREATWVDDGLVLSKTGWRLKFTDSYGGEGMGDEYWYVFTVSDGTVTRSVKVEGWYASYTGGEYDEWHETLPALKTITVWS